MVFMHRPGRFSLAVPNLVCPGICTGDRDGGPHVGVAMYLRVVSALGIAGAIAQLPVHPLLGMAMYKHTAKQGRYPIFDPLPT